MQVEVSTLIDDAILGEAKAFYEEAGLSISEAFRLMLLRAVRERTVSFDPIVPNEETIAAMLEARHGQLKSFNTLEELMADLHADD